MEEVRGAATERREEEIKGQEQIKLQRLMLNDQAGGSTKRSSPSSSIEATSELAMEHGSSEKRRSRQRDDFVATAALDAVYICKKVEEDLKIFVWVASQSVKLTGLS